jgi:threonine/homoserine/homoserine lactone efflux protein
LSSFAAFFFVTLVLLCAPGPTNALLAIGGAQRGVFASLPLLWAELAGYSLAVALIHLVLQPVLQALPLLETGLKLLFAAYVIWQAVLAWGRAIQLDPAARPITMTNLFVTTLLNPKAFGFALGIIPFQEPGVALYILTFLLLVCLSGFVWTCIGAFATELGGERGRRTVGMLGSVTLFGFAVLILSSVMR